MYFCFIVKRRKVQNESPFLLTNKNGGNRNSFHLSCVFIKEAHAVSENLRYFIKYLVRYFPASSLRSLHRLLRYQNGETVPGPRKGALDLGLKFMSRWLKSFHPLTLFTLTLPFCSSPYPHPTPKEKRRWCFSWLPTACPASLGLPPALQHPQLPNHSAAFLRCGSGGGKEGKPQVQRLSRWWI